MSSPVNFKCKSGLEFFQEQEEQGQIVTFCQSLDTLLEGGVNLGKITELFSEPGVGKTQICMQLSVSAQVPAWCGGVGGEVIYLDTDGGLVASRLQQVAQATVSHCDQIRQMQSPETDISEVLTVDKILKGIQYIRCLDDTEVMSAVHQLQEMIQNHGNIKLVVIDNVSSPFRHLMDEPFLRSQVLTMFAQTLNQIAQRFQLAVVLTNQMTTRVRRGGSVSYLVPALGDNWGHCCATRLMLTQDGEERRARLVKGGAHSDAHCGFRIAEAGIRDLASSLQVTSSNEENNAATEHTIQTDQMSSSHLPFSNNQDSISHQNSSIHLHNLDHQDCSTFQKRSLQQSANCSEESHRDNIANTTSQSKRQKYR